MQKIKSSVGRDGTNNQSDVKVIQQLLNHHQIPGQTTPLKVDGIVGPKTIARIEVFQKNVVKMTHPDGRVDPNGKTLSALNGTPIPTAESTKVIYSANLPPSKRIVSTYAISVIQLALRKAGMPRAVITSTIRTLDEQARIMYNNAKKNLRGQFKLYGATGDEVLKVYKDNQTQSKQEIIKLMKAKIEALLKKGRRTSKHVVTESQYRSLNIIDIGVNSTRTACGKTFSIKGFTDALSELQHDGYIEKLIDETKKSNTCWHIEIMPKPDKKPIPQL